MRALEEKILKEGKVFPGHVLNVGSFLNQQIDAAFMKEMGDEIARLFKDEGVTKILTVETSGIAIALAAAQSMGVNLVFAKKRQTANMDDSVYSANVYSYTHKREYKISVSKEYISAGERVLLVDDFLANGAALAGLVELCESAGACVVGCSVAIEKGFQQGGDNLRKKGYRVESLAIIDKMTDETLEFRK